MTILMSSGYENAKKLQIFVSNTKMSISRLSRSLRCSLKMIIHGSPEPPPRRAGKSEDDKRLHSRQGLDRNLDHICHADPPSAIRQLAEAEAEAEADSQHLDIIPNFFQHKYINNIVSIELYLAHIKCSFYIQKYI